MRRLFFALFLITVPFLTPGCFSLDGPRTRFHRDPEAIGPFSSAVQVGPLMLLSGKIGERGAGFEREVTTCIDSIEEELAKHGLGLQDVVAARVFLTDIGRYAEFNELYSSRFKEPYPARTCIAAAALPGGAQVEIQVDARAR